MHADEAEQIGQPAVSPWLSTVGTDEAAGQEAFVRWLRAQLDADGRSHRAVGRSLDVPHNVISRPLRDTTTRTSERYVRALAIGFGADPDEIAALAGHADVRIRASRPRGFSSISDWLIAALEARHESPEHASIGAGLNANEIRLILHRGSIPDRPTCDKLAFYFGVDRFELRALRPNRPDRIALGHRIAQAIGDEGMREISVKGRAKSREVRRQAAEKARGLAGPQRGGQKTLDRYGRGFFKRLANENGAKWLRSSEHSELLQIRHAVKRFGSPSLRRRVARQTKAEYSDLARRTAGQPVKPGRRPTLLARREAAISAAIMHVEYGVTALEIGRVVGFAPITLPTRQGDAYEAASQSTWELIALGRAIVGL